MTHGSVSPHPPAPRTPKTHRAVSRRTWAPSPAGVVGGRALGSGARVVLERGEAGSATMGRSVGVKRAPSLHAHECVLTQPVRCPGAGKQLGLLQQDRHGRVESEPAGATGSPVWIGRPGQGHCHTALTPTAAPVRLTGMHPNRCTHVRIAAPAISLALESFCVQLIVECCGRGQQHLDLESAGPRASSGSGSNVLTASLGPARSVFICNP